MLRTTRWLILLLLLPVASCRKSDDDGVDPNTWLGGAWFAVGFEQEILPAGPVSYSGVLTGDGAGHFTASMTVNAAGTIGTMTPSGTYSVGLDGAFTMSGGPPELLQGGLAPDHAAAVMSRLSSGDNPMVALLLRREGTYSTASLSGEYWIAGFQWDATTYASFFGSGTCDAMAGTYVFAATKTDGTTLTPIGATMYYAVAADGTLTVTDDPVTPTQTFSGGVMAGGDLAAAIVVTAGRDPVLIVLVRKSGAFTSASVAGAHWFVSMGPGLGEVGTATFDGVGAWTTASTANVLGTVGPNSGSGTYAMTAAGELTMNDGTVDMKLGVREGGRAAAGSFQTAAQPPWIVVALRR